MGAGIVSLVGAVVLTTGRVWQGQFTSLPVATPSAQSTALTMPSDWNSLETAEVGGLAIARFKQKDWTVGQQAVENLLDRGALQEAEAALSAVPDSHLSDPTIRFLRGRLAWQSLKQGNGDYSPDDVRRFWDLAVEAQPNSALYQTALGFAYYAEGRYQEAIEPFCRSIALAAQPSPSLSVIDRSPSPANCLPDQPPTDRQARNAYAGIALVMAQLATDTTHGTPDQLTHAIAIQRAVLESDPVHYEVQALSGDWLWNASAIQEWDRLMQLQS
ncbi:MAG: hypothetical protein HC881_02435 [Leptolyngbyaceae cyanobacterium SL_7_1]|nr:hypothetical protein [Leptolyngbyaceae cyanobacterium SL_7_1]